MRLLKIVFILSLVNLCYAQGFLHVQGKYIVDGNGNEFILRGIGLGGWLLQEGYMLHTSGFANAEHQIKSKISELIGEEKTIEFYEKYWENYVREIDIQKIFEWGFNSVRLPMHYNKLTTLANDDQYIETGFAQIDSLLSWCKKYQLYLILDLHAAPGGQSDENISDYNPAFPSLWESETNKEITIKLWKKLAERYKDEVWIGGYDLLNEPKWNLGSNNQPLRKLFINITNAIREVDTNHIIYIEGNWFATNFTGLTPAWDDNMVYSFHKYWNENSQNAIQSYLSLRESTGKPLWLGETGENSNAWFVDCVELMEQNKIGWAWWPHKKIDNIAGPLSAELTPQFNQLLDYWNGNAVKPTESFAYAALLLQADKLKLEVCRFQPDVIDALIRQPRNNSSIPYKQNSIPGIIYAVDFDMGKRGVAYQDVDYHNTGGLGAQEWNNGFKYRNDGVDIEICSDAMTNGFNVGWIEPGEWLKYTVTVDQSGIYDLNIRYAAANSEGRILITLDNQNLSDFIYVISTGGWQNWQTLRLENLSLTQGQHELTVKFFFGGFNVSYYEFVLKSVDVEGELNPKLNFNLEQNYPNPFNGLTNISYSIPNKSHVMLDVFDSKGEMIDRLFDGIRSPGFYSAKWFSDNIASGVYFLKLSSSEGFDKTIKIICMK